MSFQGHLRYFHTKYINIIFLFLLFYYHLEETRCSDSNNTWLTNDLEYEDLYYVVSLTLRFSNTNFHVLGRLKIML